MQLNLKKYENSNLKEQQILASTNHLIRNKNENSIDKFEVTGRN